MRDLRSIADRVDVIALDLAQLAQEGPHFDIEHSYWRPETTCAAGEEVSLVRLVCRGRPTRVPLSLATRLLFDYLARNKHRPQSADQIASAMRHSDFYQSHAMNSGQTLSTKFARAGIKEYIKRIRKALNESFQQANQKADSMRVLTSELTDGNEVQYRLRATVKWCHVVATKDLYR